MRQTRIREPRPGGESAGRVRVLVVSQHDLVRRHLVAYLRRSPSLQVDGDELAVDAIVGAHPDVVVLDLSQLGPHGLQQAVGAARAVSARLLALAALHDPSAARTVTAAGGQDRLKSAGADGLAESVLAAVRRPAVSAST
jgi:DNA-binding NarL/FixJ family response regulator